jgi:hypothetical protein
MAISSFDEISVGVTWRFGDLLPLDSHLDFQDW